MLGEAYNLSRQICNVSFCGTFVNNELMSNEYMISLLWLNVLAQSPKLKESLLMNRFVEMVVALETGRQVDVDTPLQRELSPVSLLIATLDGSPRHQASLIRGVCESK